MINFEGVWLDYLLLMFPAVVKFISTSVYVKVVKQLSVAQAQLWRIYRCFNKDRGWIKFTLIEFNIIGPFFPYLVLHEVNLSY